MNDNYHQQPTNHDRQIVAKLIIPMVGQSDNLINDKARL
jgi:hypothetical protein